MHADLIICSKELKKIDKDKASRTVFYFSVLFFIEKLKEEFNSRLMGAFSLNTAAFHWPKGADVLFAETACLLLAV